MTDSYSYDAFGNELSRTGTSDQPYRYLGNRYEPSTGLYDSHARHYSPSTGRFASKDPVGGSADKPQSLNPYAYGLNGPLAHPDPSGRCPHCFILAGELLIKAAQYYGEEGPAPGETDYGQSLTGDPIPDPEAEGVVPVPPPEEEDPEAGYEEETAPDDAAGGGYGDGGGYDDGSGGYGGDDDGSYDGGEGYGPNWGNPDTLEDHFKGTDPTSEPAARKSTLRWRETSLYARRRRACQRR